jgi:hypothetical protein
MVPYHVPTRSVNQKRARRTEKEQSDSIPSMAYPSDTTGATAAAAAGIAHCGSLGVALQQALEEIRRPFPASHNHNDDDDDFWNDEDHADRILEALGTAVAATNSNNSTGSNNNNLDDHDDHDAIAARPFVLTAVVDYYNRLGDRWRIVAVPETAELQVVAPPPPLDPLGGDPDDIDTSSRTKKRKRQTTAPDITTVPLPRLEVLAYKEDYYST